MDSGATYHFTPDISMLDTVTPFNGSDKVIVRNGKQLDINFGRVYIFCHVIFNEDSFPFNNLLSSLSQSVFSFSSLSVPLSIILPFISLSIPTFPSIPSSFSYPPSTSNTCPLIVAPTSLPHSSVVDLPIPSVDTNLITSSQTRNIHSMVTRSKVGIYKPKLLLSVSIGPLIEPTSFHQVVQDPSLNQAMELEFATLQHNKTWHLVPLPFSGKVIGCK